MFKRTLIAGAMLAAVAGAQAQSVSLTLAGTISPPSCTLTLGNSGVADYGTSTAATVRGLSTATGTNVHYNMGAKTLTWVVGCAAATPMQMAFADSYSGKVTAFDANDSLRYGLVDGSTGTSSIGSYAVSFTSAAATTVDGAAPNDFLHATAGSTTWAARTAPYNIYSAPGKATGFIKTAGLTAPSQLKDASGTLTVTLMLKKAYADVATSAITLTGGGTITLQYL